MKQLSKTQLLKRLSNASDWMTNKAQTELTKVFVTNSFVDGLSYIARIAVHAELLNHHPTIELSFNTVKVTLTTHDVKGLTQNDFDLAKRIDKSLESILNRST